MNVTESFYKSVYREGAGFTAGLGPGYKLLWYSICSTYSDFKVIPKNNARVMDYRTARAEFL